MNEAYKQAEIAFEEGEVPVGAIIVCNNKIVARAHNQTEKLNDSTAHAEILALTSAFNYFGAKYLPDCTLYVTLEPCTMCAGAISFARIRRLYFAAADEKGGGVEHGVRFFSSPQCHHAPEIYSGIHGEAAASLLQEFFRDRR